jgi:hypothetical protein
MDRRRPAGRWHDDVRGFLRPATGSARGRWEPLFLLNRVRAQLSMVNGVDLRNNLAGSRRINSCDDLHFLFLSVVRRTVVWLSTEVSVEDGSPLRCMCTIQAM